MSQITLQFENDSIKKVGYTMLIVLMLDPGTHSDLF